MAKTLEKVTKDFEALADQLRNAEHVADVGENNYSQLQAMAREAAKQAGQAAARLTSKGTAGKCLDDFRNHKEIKEFMKLWDKQQSTAAQLVPDAKKTAKELPPLFKKLQAMVVELKEEVANRDKKANRKIFKIQSESLPDLKKLLKEMEQTEHHFAEDVVDRAKELPAFVGEVFDPTFEALFDEEFKKSAKEHTEGDVKEMAQGAKNVRVQIKYLREGRKMQDDIKKLCTDAAKALKKGESPQPYLDSATKIYREMSNVSKTQQQLLNNLGNRKNPTGDAKKVIDSANAYLVLNKQTLTLLTKVTSATMGTVGSQKGKEKVGT